MADKTLLVKIKSYFTTAASCENLTSGEELQTSLGKVKKWFSDLGTAAFTNSTDYAASSHNQPSSTINAMTGYSKPQSTSAITASDTLNQAIGKLEKGLDGAGGGLQPGSVDVSTNNVTLTSSSPTATVTISNITGEPSLVIIGQNFNATLNNGTITITKTDVFYETGEVLVSIAGNSTYSPAVAIITVTVDGIEIVTWSGGTDEQVAAMINAAHNGDINLTDYWSVGDVRTITNLDTSVISTPTISLKLYDGMTYDDDDTSKTSNFCIGVEGTSTYSVSSIFPLSYTGFTYNLSYDKAKLIESCLPQSLNSSLLTQVIKNKNYSGSTITTRTLYSYSGEIVHSNTSKNYGSNETYYNSSSSNKLSYYYYWYSSTNNKWIKNSINYNDSTTFLTATYLMHI